MAQKPVTIAKIAVRGFKSIWDEQEIELRPLTLLAGANSSGKSSIMQPLLLLKQTLEAPADPGALLLEGPNVCFTEAGQLLSKRPGQRTAPEFSVKVRLSSEEELAVAFKHEKAIGFDVISMCYSSEEKTLKIVPTMTHEEIQKIKLDFMQKYFELIQKTEKVQPRWAVYRERCFLSFELGTERQKFRFGFLTPSIVYVPHLQSLIHLPALRGNPQRTYKKSAYGPNFPGRFEDYVASVISHWQAEEDKRLGQLESALVNMGLTWKVEAKRVDDTKVELRVGRLMQCRPGGAKDLVSIADVGFGVSQSLPVVVALIAAKPGQVVYLEQPEIHLHPLAQRKLAHIIATAARRGVVVVVETHSSLLLREVQTLVASGELAEDIVKLHWFHRRKDGSTKISSTDLDKNGAYGDWPADFDTVELESEKKYLDAVERNGSQR